MTRQNKKRGYDYSLLAVVFLLVIIGLVILYSTSAYNGQVKFHDRFYYLKKQAFATALGLALMFFMANIDYHIWQKFAVPAYITALMLSVAVLLVGDEYNGSKRWLYSSPDRKSTRLNSSHQFISYAVFCLKKKKKIIMKICDNDKRKKRGKILGQT